MNIVVSRAAQADLERLREFLDEKDPPSALRAAAAVDEAIQSLETFPERGRPTSIAGVRELIVPFGRSAYVLRYALLREADEIAILRIWHGREVRE